MQNAQYAKSYQTAAISTASPERLILMLFDGALRFMGTAVKGFEEEHFVRRNEQINNNLIKAQNIIKELQCSLDMDNGGEFAINMFKLYDYMTLQLNLANRDKVEAPIHIVEKLLGEIRDAWAEVLQKSPSAATEAA